MSSTLKLWLLVSGLLLAAACSVSGVSPRGDDLKETGPSTGGGEMGQGGFALEGQGGNLEETACAETVAEPTVVPVSMFIAVDKSGSMGGDKWDDTNAAFTAFFTDPAADDLSVALRFWPEGDCDEDSCNVQACAQPQIPLGSLADPAHEAALVALFNQTDPDGPTPMSAALAGATQWAVNQQSGGEGAERVVVVLVTDGSPNGCDESIAGISSIAADAYNVGDVMTFTVGLQGSNEQDIDAIAQAGGTQAGFFIGSGNAQAELLAALKAIQETAVACTFAMPESVDADKAVDPNKVNVTFTPAGATEPVTIGQVADESACTAAAGGWYYDDPTDPAIIQLCESTCNAVQSDDGATLNIVLGCATVVT
jgi:hypothetical protein